MWCAWACSYDRPRRPDLAVVNCRLRVACVANPCLLDGADITVASPSSLPVHSSRIPVRTCSDGVFADFRENWISADPMATVAPIAPNRALHTAHRPREKSHDDPPVAGPAGPDPPARHHHPTADRPRGLLPARYSIPRLRCPRWPHSRPWRPFSGPQAPSPLGGGGGCLRRALTALPCSPWPSATPPRQLPLYPLLRRPRASTRQPVRLPARPPRLTSPSRCRPGFVACRGGGVRAFDGRDRLRSADGGLPPSDSVVAGHKQGRGLRRHRQDVAGGRRFP